MRLALLLVFLVPAGAGALSSDWSGFRALLDDSDPESKARVERFTAATPCARPQPLVCERAISILAAGGDRTARYLVNQKEAMDTHPWTLLRMIGHTRSDVAFEMLAGRLSELSNQPDPTSPAEWSLVVSTLEGLGRTVDSRAVDLAPRLYARFDHGRARMRVIGILEKRQRHARLPEATLAWLREARNALPWEASEAERELYLNSFPPQASEAERKRFREALSREPALGTLTGLNDELRAKIDRVLVYENSRPPAGP